LLERDYVYRFEDVKEAIIEHKSGIDRLNKLLDYYKGENQAILSKASLLGKPSNKIAHAYGNIITTTITGYFMGKPVTYTSSNEEYLKELQKVFNWNDEPEQNYEISLLQSIYGTAYELVYTDEDGEICFNELSPTEAFIKYDDGIKPKPLFAVRYGENTITVYTKESVIEYSVENNKQSLVSETEHFFGAVPMIEYKNNTFGLGDFETVMSLIDAYDRVVSNKLNDVDYFSDAYLILTGIFPDNEELARMRDNRVIMLNEIGKAEFLTKPEADKGAETIRLHLKQDIHRFSGIPDTAESEYGNRSGISLEYKNFNLNQITAIKQRRFHRALQDRIRLVTEILNIKKKKDWKYEEIAIVFGINKPVNNRENAEIAVMLNGLVSKQTLLGSLNLVEDVSTELSRLQQEELNSIYPTEQEAGTGTANAGQIISNRKRIRTDYANYSPDTPKD
jgi:SPP1 family phage portal protein